MPTREYLFYLLSALSLKCPTFMVSLYQKGQRVNKMLIRKDFRAKAEEIGQIVSYIDRTYEAREYASIAKKSNPRFSYSTFIAWVEKVAQAKSDLKRVQETVSGKDIAKQRLYTQHDLDNERDASYQEGHGHGFESGVDSVYENGNNEKYSCSKCDMELTSEHVERLSNLDKPRIDNKDICKLVFDMSDYN